MTPCIIPLMSALMSPFKIHFLHAIVIKKREIYYLILDNNKELAWQL